MVRLTGRAVGAAVMAVFMTVAGGFLVSRSSDHRAAANTAPAQHGSNSAAPAPRGASPTEGSSLFVAEDAKALGISLQTSRAAGPENVSLWAASGANTTCVKLRSTIDPAMAFGACVAADIASEQGVFAVSHPDPDLVKRRALPSTVAEVAGLVPDGVSSVHLTQLDGAGLDVSVVNNGFVVTLTGEPAGARFTTSSGKQRLVDLNGEEGS